VTEFSFTSVARAAEVSAHLGGLVRRRVELYLQEVVERRKDDQQPVH
jgi:hypothetical protein